jgi:hypothetical protein
VDVPPLFYFTPKIWQATQIFLFPRHNIMQGDETPFANKCRVCGKVGFHALIAMIAVDEKKIERLAASSFPGRESPLVGSPRAVREFSAAPGLTNARDSCARDKNPRRTGRWAKRA